MRDIAGNALILEDEDGTPLHTDTQANATPIQEEQLAEEVAALSAQQMSDSLALEDMPAELLESLVNDTPPAPTEPETDEQEEKTLDALATEQGLQEPVIENTPLPASAPAPTEQSVNLTNDEIAQEVDEATAIDEPETAQSPAASPVEPNQEANDLLTQLKQLVALLEARQHAKQSPNSQFATAIYHAKQQNDYHQAARWFRRAGLQGHSRAQFYLGMLFIKGQGVPRSLFHAYAWLSLAACQQVTEAVSARKQLEGQLSSRECNMALKYAADLFEQMNQL